MLTEPRKVRYCLEKPCTAKEELSGLENMTADTETQGEYDDGGSTGPGAPTPLSALEVSKTEM